MYATTWTQTFPPAPATGALRVVLLWRAIANLCVRAKCEGVILFIHDRLATRLSFYSKNGRRRVVSEPHREVEGQVTDLVLKRRVGVRPEQQSDHPCTPVAAVVHCSPV